MLYSELPAENQRGKYHHFWPEVPSVEKAKAILQQRAASIGYTRSMDIQTGVNRKRQLNLLGPRTALGLS